MAHSKRIASWGMRFAVNFFTLALTLLFFWLLGFVVKDLRTIPGPPYADSEKLLVDRKILDHKEKLERLVDDLETEIKDKKRHQVTMRDDSGDIDKTIKSLKQAQKEGNDEVRELADNLWAQFLKRREQIVSLGEEVLAAEKNLALQRRELKETNDRIEVLKRKAWEHHYELSNRHRFWLAVYQIGTLSPFFFISVFFLVKKRRSPYFPVYLAFTLATFFQIGFVMFEYFPRHYFKYILISFLICAVLYLLILVIRTGARPTNARILKQNRESYERFLCVRCEYPIRTGPRTFLYWTRRTVHKRIPAGTNGEEEIYACPHCGLSLYETCPGCGKIRHAQLEFCRHCGEKKEIDFNSSR